MILPVVAYLGRYMQVDELAECTMVIWRITALVSSEYYGQRTNLVLVV